MSIKTTTPRSGLFARGNPGIFAAVTALIVWRSRIHMLFLLGAGAALGWYGWV